MSHWPFIYAAYGLTALVTFGVLAWSYVAMRKAEKAADALRQGE